MLDIKFIREHKDIVKEGARRKRVEIDIDRLLEIDDERKAMMAEVEKRRAEQNEMGDKIALVSDQKEKARMIDDMKTVKKEMQRAGDALDDIMRRWQALMVQVPNVPDVSVPDGASDADNREIRTWGEQPAFSFKAKSHIELCESLRLADFERGTKVAGFRGYFLTGDGVLLANALLSFALEHFATKGGFRPMQTPALVRREALVGTAYIPQGEADLFKTQDDFYLSGTAEVPMMSYLADEIVPRASLPLKFVAFSPCYRREAGSYGKDAKGLFRVHEFTKWEQIVLCEANHEESARHHEALTKNAEELLQALQLPYRVVLNCGGDLGLGQVKKYDLETWVPSENRYRETHSSSYFHDFQSRRLNIRYKDAEGKLRFVHSLNNTAIAVPRILVPLLECNQLEDGSVKIPDALRKFMQGREVMKKH